ncbi:MAG: hypothetical protein JSS02_04740 [Planctomycetes bacterium]|nr:hypothetical protein [Planctomycetota bacterium]
MISIGAVVGGPECIFFLSQLRKLMGFCQEARDRSSPTAMVNVVYHLPGSVCKPDYLGLRTATFSKNEKKIQVQVSVEAEWIDSRDEMTVLCYIYETADEALGLGFDEMNRRGIEYDLAADRLFLDSWKAALGFRSNLDDLSKD